MAWSFYNSSGKLIDGVLDSSITNAKMVDDAIDSDEIVAGSIDNAHMSVNSIDSDQYVDGSIDLAHMSVNSIDSDQYVDASIDSAHIANDQIDSQHYAAGSIDLEHMASQSVDEDNLYISNAGSNGEFLSKSSNAGGLTWAAAGGAVTREGSNTTEATSTTTSVVDILTNTGLSIAATSPIQVWANHRRTSGSSDNNARAFAVNNTAVMGGRNMTTTADTAQDGCLLFILGARVTNYTHSFITLAANTIHVGSFLDYISGANSSSMTLSTINDLDIQGVTYHSAVTIGYDECHIYSNSTS